MKNSLIGLLASLLVLGACQSGSANTNGNDKNNKIAIDTTQVTVRKPFNEAKIIHALSTLSSDAYEGRKPGTNGHKMAQEYILKAFDSLGVKMIGGSYLQSFQAKLRHETTETAASNIVGYIPGTVDSSTYIVVGAHYDHVGFHKGEIHNGADDNASGIGGLLAVADYFTKNPPKHSILLLAFDAEESGLQGARYYANNPTVPANKMAVMINMDMISRSDSYEVYASGTNHYPSLLPVIERVASENTAIRVLTGHDLPKEKANGSQDWTFSSDHGPFHEKGIPYIYFGVEDHPHYHKPSDDFETININFYLNVVDAVLDAVEGFDKQLARKAD